MIEGKQQEVAMLNNALGILRMWKLDHADQLKILGLPDDIPKRFIRQPGSLLARHQANDLSLRIHYLQAIYAALGNLYPHCEPAAHAWISAPNPYFPGSSPIQEMLDEGITGMKAVIEHLNGTLDW